MSRPVLVLASASPARRRLLAAAGVEPRVQRSAVDERAVERTLGPVEPSALAHALALAKARDVAVARAPEQPSGARELVVGCDSVLDVDGEALGRPADADDAVLRWRRLRGRSATLVTGHAVLDVRAGAVVASSTGVAATVVRFGRPSDAEVAAYVATGEPLEVAGSFTLDGLGGWFVEGVDGDPSCVVGLSLPLLRRLLADLGVAVVDLWEAGAPVSQGPHDRPG